MVDNEEILAHDLRQKYAEIVGVHLEAVAMARISKNYPEYFDALENLSIVTEHKFTQKKRKYGEEILSDTEYYEQLLTSAINIINQYPNVYLGKTAQPGEVVKVKRALHKIEKFFYKVLDEAKVFGSKWDNDGL